MYRTIRSCLVASTVDSWNAILEVLEMDLGVHITVLHDKKDTTKYDMDTSPDDTRCRTDPVLKVMGVDAQWMDLTVHCGSTTRLSV